MTALEIVKLLEKKGISAFFSGTNSSEVNQVSGLIEANENNISFFNDLKRLTELQNTSAGIVILQEKYAEQVSSCKIFVEDPYVAYAIVSQFLNIINLKPGIAVSAIVSTLVTVPSSCQIEANVVICDNVKIGKNCIIGAGSVIKDDCIIGNNVTIYSNVVIEKNCKIGNNTSIESGTVIGGQGFGFANNKGQWLRIPQIGRVLIGNNVWIGNNCSIDRGTLNNTIIEDNCIIDNLVHIAHNVEIGCGSAIAGQVGFAGSTKIGKYNVFAGQVGITGHINTADNCHFGAKAGITNNVKLAGNYSGFPAIETASWQKSVVRIKSLDKVAKKIKDLEKELQKLKRVLEK